MIPWLANCGALKGLAEVFAEFHHLFLWKEKEKMRGVSLFAAE